LLKLKYRYGDDFDFGLKDDNALEKLIGFLPMDDKDEKQKEVILLCLLVLYNLTLILSFSF
jgi:hypothetical protein